MAMSKKSKEYVCDVIDKEGFDYAFINYSSFSNIKDLEFHKRRKAVIKAINAMYSYIEWEKNSPWNRE